MTYHSDGHITIEDLKELFDTNQKVIVIDIRTKKERMYLNMGGVHIPNSKIASHANFFKTKYSGYIIVVACLANMIRGKGAMKTLKKEGVNVLTLEGGITGWAAKHKTHKFPEK